MIINRQNYEEYFLLYADDELKPQERKQVEAFVAENEDLKSEFEFFQQMKLDPTDHTSFPEKASLFKPMELQDDQYQPNPQELQLLMYLDNEMETEERLAFEQKLKLDKKLRAEFDILLNARLEPDFRVRFEDKDSLYRHVEKPARLIRITWLRVAVAASVLLIAGFLWLNNQNEIPVDNTSIAKNNSGGTVDSQVSQSKTEENAELLKKSDTNAAAAKSANDQLVLADIGKIKTDNKPAVAKKESAEKADNQPEGHNKRSQLNLPEQPEREMAKADPNKTKKVEPVSVEEDIPVRTASPGEDLPVQSDLSYVSASNIKSNYATDALMQAETSSTDTEFVDEEKPRKGALRGIFRKANRFFNKVTNPDPNLPSVRVANLEIALAR